MAKYYELGYDARMTLADATVDKRITCTVCKKSRLSWSGFYSTGNGSENVGQNLTCTDCYENYRLQGVIRRFSLCDVLDRDMRHQWACSHEKCDNVVHYVVRESNGYDRLLCGRHGVEFENSPQASKLKNNSWYMVRLLWETTIKIKGFD